MPGMGDPDPSSRPDDAIHRALAQVEAELAELEPQYEALTVRLMQLRRAHESLRPLVGLEDHPAQRERPSRRRSDDERHRRMRERARRRGLDIADRYRDLVASTGLTYNELTSSDLDYYLQQAMRDAGDEPTSTSRVMELLREANGEPVTRRQIMDAFELRGWINPGWREPDAAVRMAISRAAARPEVVRKGHDAFAWSDQEPETDSAEEGDA